MSSLADIEAASQEFASGHSFDQDVWSTSMGMHLCPHFGPWITDLAPVNSEEWSAFSALTPGMPSNSATAALASLQMAELPPGWMQSLTWALKTAPASEFVGIAIGALYGLVAQRLYESPPTQASDVRALVYLVEGTVEFEYAYIEAIDSINYVPMGNVEVWWRDYLSTVDATLTDADLRQVSQARGGACETEMLSSLTPGDRLVELYKGSGVSSTLAANPNLPADLVNEQMKDDWSLLFHPNADRDRSWEIIQGVLEDGEYEDLANSTMEFGNMRDDNWYAWSGFGTASPQAQWLKDRMRQWIEENMDDDDEREEALEMLGVTEFDG
jgi:hypothetical protein